MKRRILFVDDEQRILDGMRRMLRPLRAEWDVEFALGGREALERMRDTRFHVIVSDIRMPGIDGAALLREVRRLHPDTVRVALSGDADKDTVLGLAGCAHQYLSKPCEPEVLKGVLRRACRMSGLLATEKLRGLIAGIESLPSLPSIYSELMDELQSPEASISRVESIVKRDIAMSGKVLQLVNSSFFGLRRRVSDPGHAVNLLGFDVIRALALSIHLFTQFDVHRLKIFSLADLWRHCLMVAVFSKRIAQAHFGAAPEVDDAFVAGLLHDVGVLALAAELPDELGEAMWMARETDLAISEAERRVIGASHPEIGAYLMGLWGLPDNVVDAILGHHEPSRVADGEFGSAMAVHVANTFAQELHQWQPGINVTPLEIGLLRRLGAEEKVEAWRDLCCEPAMKEEAL